MRYLLTIMAAMLAVACGKAERQDAAADTQAAASDAVATTAEAARNVGSAVKDTYKDAEPELKHMGRAIGAGVKEVAQETEETIHENTAPDPDDPSPAASQ